MRPIKLTMQAFGAYAGLQEVDFRQLQGRNFFLIHGPTGSGKTTLLDAICFALYGATSGGDRSIEQMRSDHADAATATEVSFDFSLGRKLYRVVRRPEQELKKQRGEGTTKKLQMAALYDRTAAKSDAEEGELLESKWSAVNATVTGLLGFECDQFRQVVVIPQGKFRELLNAPTKDRQEILRVLFQTNNYEALQEALKAAKSEIARELDQLKGRTAHILGEAGAESAEALERRKEELAEEIAHLAARRQALEAERAERQGALDEARKISDRLRELEEARAGVEALSRGEAAHREREAELKRARAALPLLPEEEALKRAVEDRRKADEQCTEADAALKAAARAREAAAAALERERGREAEREEAQKGILKLRGMAERVEALEGQRAALETAQRALQAKSAERERTARARTDALRKAEELRARREAALTRAAGAGALAAEVKALQEAASQLGRLQDLTRQLEPAEQLVKECQEQVRGVQAELARARAALEGAEQRWLRGQAALLARGLAEGAPCPVCGATDHPAPAATTHDIPEEAEIRQRREAVSALQQGVDECAKNMNEAQRGLDRLQTVRGEIIAALGERSQAQPAALKQALLDKRKALEEAERAGAALAGLEQECAGAERAVKESETRLSGLEEELKPLIQSEADARAKVASCESEIPEALRRREALASAIARAEAQLKQLQDALESARRLDQQAAQDLVSRETQLRGITERCEELRRREESARLAFDAALLRAGFASHADYAGAIRTAAQVAALEAALQKYQEAVAAARARLEKAAALAEGLQAPDTAALAAAVGEINEQIAEASNRQGALAQQAEQVAGWLGALGDSARKQEKLERRFGVMGKIADIANGVGGFNRANLSFERFIQGVWLDRVLARASLRLGRMSRERFILKRLHDPVHGRAAAGLDLQVHDNYTGTDRPVGTLSGGESFMASLALALGLADVVQARSGGIHLETIFVDEGFGSLDPEALDLAMATLIDLQQGGRLVGIISHVPELKERIDVRLEIEAGKRGSQARFHLS